MENTELESFRRQWLEEVARKKQPQQQQQQPARDTTKRPPQPQHLRDDSHHDEDENVGRTTAAAASTAPVGYETLAKEVRSLSISTDPDDTLVPDAHVKPTSALEHFEQAVSKEAQGMLGESLDLYRKAYKLDSKVDQTYRSKHFPPSALKIADKNPSKAPVTVPDTAHHSSEASELSTPDLIASFSRLRIPGAEPIIENTPPPPCPIAKVPSEVLAAILKHVALLDPASMARVALVCKRLAYHVAHEQQVWRRLCQGPEFGFASMHYTFACDIHGSPLRRLKKVPRYTPFPFGLASLEIPRPFTTWSQVFQTFPRIRFTGIYICTVNYTRPGSTAALQNVSWNSPVHIVTYYRYLRFYPDGSLISLLTTVKPVDVVPWISKENLETVKVGVPAGHQRHLSDPAAVQPPVANPVPSVAAGALKGALRGRWHLGKPASTEPEPADDDDSSSSVAEEETSPPPPPPSIRPAAAAAAAAATSTASSDLSSDLHDLFIETEGVDPKYMYTMHLALRSTAAVAGSKTSKNTKLVWKGFWSYNHLTDDWAEFMLRNDGARSFVFRRVRGWGMA